jgi:hypothetical protein
MEKDKETEYYVPDRTMYSSKKNRYSKWSFRYEPERDVYQVGVIALLSSKG